MLRYVLVKTSFGRLLGGGVAHLCGSLVLMSVLLWAGCEHKAQRTPPTPPHEPEGDAVPAPPQASHSPPVRVPPRPTLTPIPAARLDELFRNPEIRPAATWEDRKRQVAENPEVVWQPGFIVPPGAEHHHPPSLGELWDYTTVADAVTFSECKISEWMRLR